jgi:predicted thioesterase
MKKKMLNYLVAAFVVLVSMFAVSSAALADPALDFEVTSVGYDNGALKAIGSFKNTGDKNIETVTKVDVKISLFNDDGEGKEVAHQYFTDLKVHLKPGEAAEATLEFTNVPEYVDATKWDAQEGEWEFTYFEDEAAEAAPAE